MLAPDPVSALVPISNPVLAPISDHIVIPPSVGEDTVLPLVRVLFLSPFFVCCAPVSCLTKSFLS